ncbi:MAG: iron dependent repressor, metal binding and dimerization domain protein, partial [Clostridia bacterium]
DNGREIAKRIYSRHITIKTFLINLGVSEQTAETDACKIEHIISEETLQAIKNK